MLLPNMSSTEGHKKWPILSVKEYGKAEKAVEFLAQILGGVNSKAWKEGGASFCCLVSSLLESKSQSARSNCSQLLLCS